MFFKCWRFIKIFFSITLILKQSEAIVSDDLPGNKDYRAGEEW